MSETDVCICGHVREDHNNRWDTDCAYIHCGCNDFIQEDEE